MKPTLKSDLHSPQACPSLLHMPSGIKIADVEIGAGLLAEKGKTVFVHLVKKLSRGDVLMDSRSKGAPLRIDLGRRDCIAGLRKGIEGMRVGGRRKLVISPHLAYGVEGIPSAGIPPNAVLHCDVELIEVREPGVMTPEDFAPGRSLHLHHPGLDPESERWQFYLQHDGRNGAYILRALPGLSWRHAAQINTPFPDVSPERADALMDEVLAFRLKHPSSCVPAKEVGSMGGYDFLRDGEGRPCLSVSICERGQSITCFYAHVRDENWLATELCKWMMAGLRSHLGAGPHV